MNFWLKFFLVFLVVTASDACWAVYIIRIGEKKALAASGWGSLISLMTAFTIVSYTENHWFIIATILGAFAGTFLAIKLINK